MENAFPPPKYPLRGIPIPFQYRTQDDIRQKFEDRSSGSKTLRMRGFEECGETPDGSGGDYIIKRSRVDEILNTTDLGTPVSGNYSDNGTIQVIGEESRLVNIAQEGINTPVSVNTTSTTLDRTVTTVNNGNSITTINTLSDIIVDEALLPSPVASPTVENSIEEDTDDIKALLQSDFVDLRENLEFSTFYSTELFSFIEKHFPQRSFKNLLYQLLSNMDRRELSDLGMILNDNLKRDFITTFPIEIALRVLENLKFSDLSNCLQVCESWNALINRTPYLWKQLLISENFVEKENFIKYTLSLKAKYPQIRNCEDVYRIDFLQNCHFLQNWYNLKFTPQITTLRGHITSVITCLQLKDNYVITGADDKMIRVIDAKKKEFLLELSGHDGGVWALKYDDNGIIVSGSTDRTVRIWDIKRKCCTHVFKGHTSTVRCLDIVEHKGVKYIVTGSRDNTLHIWKLPQETSSPSDDESRYPICYNAPEENPYFVGILRGHMASVRTVSGHGNIIISGSYDNNLMVWDIAQMKCLYILTGHTDRVYCTIYDHKRKRCISASMDSTIKVWDLVDIHNNGRCVKVMNSMSPCVNIMGSMSTLQGHTALVGLLKLSKKFLVSAAADGSLRGWDSDHYSRRFAYHHSNLSAITAFDMNDNLLVSGSEGQFNIYNLRSGKLIHSNILRNADQIWSVNFKENILVAAVEKDSQSYVEILDFSISESTPSRNSILLN